MNLSDILDWTRASPQWSALLASARDSRAAKDMTLNPLWPVYGCLTGHRAQYRPFVIGQIGQTLDGRIATATGQSHYINGESAITHLHRIRALVDAVVIGVGTAIADDPQLTVRHVAGSHPARVVIDPHGRLPLSAKCLAADGVRRIIVQASNKSWPAGIEVLNLPEKNVSLEPQEIISALHAVGFRRILIEGGSNTLSRFLNAACLDRLHVMVAPMIIGSGPIGVELPAISSLADALRPAVSVFKLPEGDVLFDCAFQP